MSQPKRILLGMLISNGDCLMATVLAKQIKTDFPGSHLTWAISDLCRNIILNNPFVDEVWEIKLKSREDGLKEGWQQFRQAATERKNKGDFDEMFFTQIYPDNVHHFDGTTRGTIYGAYPFPVTVEPRPVLVPVSEEIEKLRAFAEQHHLSSFKQVILMECSSFSGQSFVNTEWALSVSAALIHKYPDLAMIISTHEKLESPSDRIIIANSLTLRENVPLSQYCSLLVGCSSGVTWICTSDRARRLPMVQFLKKAKGFSFASVVYDHAWWGLDHSLVLESTKSQAGEAVMIISLVLEKGMVKAKAAHHEVMKPKFISLVKYSLQFLRKGKPGKSFGILRNFIRRNYLSNKNQNRRFV
jgi:hypothetical protein